jgi:hypothetical protein
MGINYSLDQWYIEVSDMRQTELSSSKRDRFIR